jgi:hypothetical protein
LREVARLGEAARLGKVARSLGHDLAVARRLGPRGIAAEVRGLLPGAAPRRTGGSGGYEVDFPIDVVYTWVDGADAAWRTRRDAAWTRAKPAEHNRLAANTSRYVNRDELRYSLRSLTAYADWVRRIFIVTDRQVPSWLDTGNPRLRVVDHSEIFAAVDGLPTFNSHAIESRLHHIEGLGEHYLYLNDDMFLGRECVPETFYFGNGIARLFPSPKTVPDGPATAADTPVCSAGKNNRMLLSDKFGRAPSRRMLHAPYPQLRSVVLEAEGAYAAEFARTALSRFRHPDDISVPASLIGHYAYLTGRAVPGSLSYAYVDLADPHLNRRLRRLRTARPQVFCLNDHADSTADPGTIDVAVRTFLATAFPRPSEFELS